jgi:hypothetical protein
MAAANEFGKCIFSIYWIWIGRNKIIFGIELVLGRMKNAKKKKS